MLEEEITGIIIASAIEVHRHLGPGLLESAYAHCLAFELRSRGLDVKTEVPLLVVYKGVTLECGYRLDVLVNNKIIVEIKSVDQLAPIHEAQLISYLKLSGKRVGLIVNFNVQLLKDGIMRRVL